MFNLQIDSKKITNIGWEEDFSKIKEEIAESLNPILLQIPELLDFISKQLQSKISYLSLKSLVERASFDQDELIKRELDRLSIVYGEEILYRYAQDFLNHHMGEIREFYLKKEGIEEGFIFFENKYASTPLHPFLGKFRKIFDSLSSFSDISLFEYVFKKEIRLSILSKLVKRERENIIHHSGGHCLGVVLTLASPLKGNYPAFIQVPYVLSKFFERSTKKDTIRTFGEQVFNMPKKVLDESMPLLSNAMIKISKDNPTTFSSSFSYALITRIAAGIICGSNASSFSSYDRVQMSINLGKIVPDVKALKVIGNYIIRNPSRFPELLPDLLKEQDPVSLGTLAYNAITPSIERLRLINEAIRLSSLAPIIEKRGLIFTGFIKVNQSLHDLPSDLEQLGINAIGFQNYGLSIQSNKICHVFYLGFRSSSFLFSDPNSYCPMTFSPIVHTFSDINELSTFVYLHILEWYPSTETFNVEQYSQIHSPTPQIKEYMFSQYLARRQFLLNEIEKWTHHSELLNERMQKIDATEETENINTRLTQVAAILNYLKEELKSRGASQKLFIEEKIASYKIKYDSSKKKSYELVIQSLSNLL